jgi:hypothetical protein
MKKLTLCLLSLGAVYTVQAIRNEESIGDLAAQRANLDRELQIFAQNCKKGLLLTNDDADFIGVCTIIGAMFGISADSLNATKFLIGSTIGLIGSLLYVTIQKNYILYLDKARLQLQQELFERDRLYAAM